MPKNRRDVDKEFKKQEVIEVARELFMSRGYYDTSMANVAKNAGIAPNTIYWYFKNKEDLFAAVINGVIAAHLVEFQNRTQLPFEKNVFWALERLMDAKPLAVPLHDLMTKSEQLAQVHDSFHQLVKGIATQYLLQEGVNKSDAINLVGIWEYVLEGLILHGANDEERNRLCEFLLGMTKQIMETKRE